MMGFLTEDGNKEGTFSWRKMYAMSGWVLLNAYCFKILFTVGLKDIPTGVGVILSVILTYYFGKENIPKIFETLLKRK